MGLLGMLSGAGSGGGVNVGSAIAYLELNTSAFQTGIQTALGQLGGFQSDFTAKLGALGSSVSSIGASLTNTVTRPIVGGLKTAVTNTMNFEEKLSKVEAVSGATADEMIKLKKAAQDMALGTKFTTTEVADAMVYMGMAGWDATKILGGLSGVINLAQASGEGLATVSDIVTDDLTAFGMSAEEAAHFADVLAVASAKSNTNVGLMGESFKFAGPLAGTLGYSIEDVALATGLMANNSIKGAMAGTTLRSALTRMINPTKDAIGVMVDLGLATETTEQIWNHNKIAQKEYQLEQATLDLDKAQLKYNEAVAKYGENSTQAQTALINVEKAQNKVNEAERKYNIELQGTIESTGINNELLFDSTGHAKSFKDVLVNLRNAFANLTPEEQASAAATLFGQRAMSGMLAIINSSDEDFNSLIKNLNDSGNAAEEMSNKMMDNLAGSLYQLKSALEVLSQAIGDRIAPYIRKFADHLTELAKKFTELSDSQLDFIIKIGLVAAAIGPVLLIIGKLISTISSISSIVSIVSGSLSNLAGVFGIVGGSIGAVIAIVAAFAAAVIYLWNTNEEFRNGVIAVWEKVKATVGAAIESIKEALEALEPVFDWILEIWGTMAVKVLEVLTETFSGAIEFITGILQIIAGVVQVFTEGDWTMLWEGIKNVVSGAFDFLVALVKGWVNVFLAPFKWLYDVLLGHSIIPDICEGMIKWFTEAFDKVVQLLKDFVDKIIQWFKDLFEKIKEWFVKLGERIKEWFEETVQKTKDFFQRVIDNTIEFFSNIFNKITEFIVETISRLVDFFNEVLSRITEFVTSAIVKIREFFANVIVEVVEKINEITNRVRELLTNLINTVVEFITNIWERIKEFLNNLKNITSEFIGFLKETVGKVKEFFAEIISTIVEKIQEIISKVKEYLSELVEAIVEKAKEITSKVQEFFSELISNIVEKITEIYNKIKEFFSEVTNAISEFISTTWEKVKSFLEDIKNTVVEGIETLIEKTKELFKNIVETIREKLEEVTSVAKEKFGAVVEFVSQLIPRMMQAGRDFIASFWNGMNEVFGSLWSWVQDAFNGIVNFVEGIWDRISNIGGMIRDTVGGFFDGSHATGLSYVPYNGYIAQLHEGERVLTKQENREYSEGKHGGGDVYNIYSYEKLDEYNIRRELEKMKRQLDL